tara:strand:- start:65 stop:586 length:522 start_codon:yes stop_codon:yes gene_type:complete
MIEVFDVLLTPDKSNAVFRLVMDSLYRIGWNDTNEPQYKGFPCLYSQYSFEDVTRLKILDPVLKKLKRKKITIKNYSQCIVNLTKPMDVNFIHVHEDEIVALYYCNLTWQPEWGGETLFYKDDKRDILLSNPYVPNRLIIFDGKIAHTIKAQNILGPSYRFTISLFFNKTPGK